VAGLAPRTVLQVHRVLHQAFKFAVSEKLLGSNPADGTKRPRVSHIGRRTLSVDEVAQLFESTRSDRLYPLWVTLITTGLRHGEAGGLKWSDVDLERGRLIVERQLQRPNGRGLVFCEPKSAQSRRRVPLPPIAIEALRQHERCQAQERVTAGSAWEDRTEYQGLVFTSVVGRPLEPARVRDSLHRALDIIGVPPLRVHDLRHTCATLLFTEFEMHPRMVQALLGHSTCALTLDTYTHVIPSALDPVAEGMQTLFGGSRGTSNASRNKSAA
jgi:integrase